VLAGSFFSLGGVWLSNRNSARNLKAQLDHDRDIRAKEREMSMRKDIYLAAPEAIAAGYYAVAKCEWILSVRIGSDHKSIVADDDNNAQWMPVVHNHEFQSIFADRPEVSPVSYGSHYNPRNLPR